ncbi:MAG: hypothetical protein AAGG07_11915 [Planctomycetota bacterium]
MSHDWRPAISGGVGSYGSLDLAFDTRLTDLDPGSFFQLGAGGSGEPFVIGTGRSTGELFIGSSFVDSVSVTRLGVDFRCSAAERAAWLGFINAADIEAMLESPEPAFAAPTDAADFLDVIEFLRVYDAGCP